MDLNKLLIDAHNLINSGKGSEAEIILKKIIKKDSSNIFALNNLGNLSLIKNNYEESLEYFNQSLHLKPDFCEALINKASCLQKLKRNFEALDCYKEAIKIKPNLVDIFYNQGNCLIKLKRFEEAIKSYNELLKSKPNYYKAIFNKAFCLEQLDKYQEALKNYNIAIEIYPDFYQAITQKGNCLQKLNKHHEALDCYKKAIEINPDFSHANNNLGHLQLLLGNYEDGWKNYEWRKKISKDDYSEIYKKIEWSGKKNISEKTIFISKEQGLGDYIQFCRYLPMVKKLGAKIILDPPSALKNLIDNMKIDYTHIDDLKTKKFDYHCSIASLPLAFKTKLETIPNNIPYLFTPKNIKDYWKEKLKGDKIKIGLKWSGNKNYYNDHNRSTKLETFAPLFDSAFEFHSLQIEYSDEDEKFKQKIPNLFCHKDQILGLDNTAGLIDAMDLIIIGPYYQGV